MSQAGANNQIGGGGGSTIVETLSGNSGGAVSPTLGNINTVGSGSITIVGNPGTSTLSTELTGLTAHNILLGEGTATVGLVAPTANTGAVLQNNSGADPTYSTATYPSTTTINDILYSSANNTVGQITAGNNGVLISGTTGVPSWLPDGTTGQFLTATTGSPPSWSTVAPGGVTSVTGTANQILASPTTGSVVVSLVGPYTPATYTAHGVLVGEGTSSIVATAAGATGQVLQGNTGADPTYSTATYPSTTTINQILYSSSANTVAGLATANNGVLITSAGGVPSILPDGTTGQVLTATTGAPPSWVSPATSGTVTSVSVVSANGLAGTVATATTTPAITLTTTATGVLSGNGTAISGSAITQYDVLVGGASNAVSSVGPGSAGQILQSAGNAANPAYSTATYPATTGANTMLISTSANVVTTATFVQATTFTPVLAFGGASVGITYSQQVGTYTRIGNTVFFIVAITLTSKGSSTGSASLTGLPVSSANDGANYTHFLSFNTITAPAASTYFIASMTAASSSFNLSAVAALTGAVSSIADTNFANNTVFRIQGHYFV